MSYKELLKTFKRKLAFEAFIKSLFFGLIVGFAANFLYAFFDWLFGLKMIFVGVAIFAGVTLVCTALAYFIKFRPTDKDVARRVDGLGLEERVITMNELLGDDSYIAKKQREDTVKMIGTVSASLLTFVVSAGLIVAVSVSAAASVGLSVFSVVADKPGVEVFYDVFTPEYMKYVEVAYEVEGDGVIEGDDYQRIEYGGNCTSVTAVAMEGWEFIYWSDGETNPTRTDKKVTENAEYYAIFMEVEDGDDGEGDGDGQGEDPFDGNPTQGSGNGQGGDQQGPPQDGGSPSQDQQGNGEGDGGGDINGRTQQNNQIINGETYYGDLMGDAIGDAASNNGDGEGDGMGDLIGDYLGGLTGGEN